MNKIITLFILLFSMFGFAHANSEQTRKIELIKRVYKIELGGTSKMDSLKSNATPEFKKVLNIRDAIHSRYGGEYCDWVRVVYFPGQDHDIKLSQMKFSTLSNGLVRAEGINFGEKFHRDFKVNCNAQSCKIDDVYEPASYKNEMKRLAKNPYC